MHTHMVIQRHRNRIMPGQKLDPAVMTVVVEHIDWFKVSSISTICIDMMLTFNR